MYSGGHLESLHWLINSSRTGPCSSSSPWRKLINAVSSANFTRYLPGWELVQLLVYKINKKKNRTQPWGEPVFVINLSYSERPTFTWWTFWLRWFSEEGESDHHLVRTPPPVFEHEDEAWSYWKWKRTQGMGLEHFVLWASRWEWTKWNKVKSSASLLGW